MWRGSFVIHVNENSDLLNLCCVSLLAGIFFNPQNPFLIVSTVVFLPSLLEYYYRGHKAHTNAVYFLAGSRTLEDNRKVCLSLNSL